MLLPEFVDDVNNKPKDLLPGLWSVRAERRQLGWHFDREELRSLPNKA